MDWAKRNPVRSKEINKRSRNKRISRYPEAFKKLMNERYKKHYQKNREKEIQRVMEWRKNNTMKVKVHRLVGLTIELKQLIPPENCFCERYDIESHSLLEK
jgi:hypothetical protein